MNYVLLLIRFTIKIMGSLYLTYCCSWKDYAHSIIFLSWSVVFSLTLSYDSADYWGGVFTIRSTLEICWNTRWSSVLLQESWWTRNSTTRWNREYDNCREQLKISLILSTCTLDRMKVTEPFSVEFALIDDRVNQYPTMHFSGNPRHTQSMRSYVLTEYFWKFQWMIALWECC